MKNNSPTKISLLKQLARAVARAPLVGAGLIFNPRGSMSASTVQVQNQRNKLREYFDAHNEGHGIWKFDHYFDFYHRYLSKFIDKPVTLLEISIYSGGSLQMWRRYFGPSSLVLGVDIEPD